jgi:integrase
MVNLAAVETETRLEKAAGATTTTTHNQAATKGILVQFLAYLEKEGYSEDTSYHKLMRALANRGVNLLDPENVKVMIAKQSWKKSTKQLAVNAYDVMAKMLNLTWDPPSYYPLEESLPWIPEEIELDQLIASCRSRRMAAFLQTLKETFADPSEALRLRWKDVDFTNNIITINIPVKGHRPRQLKVSSKLLAMLNALPKTSERIFHTTYDTMVAVFNQVRKRAARNLQNPRLLSITMKTYRHWGATMIAYYTHGNVLIVQRLLGHKRIQTTMRYIGLIHFKDDEFDVATANTAEEAKQLAAEGFEKFDEFQGIHIYRRPKRFQTLGFASPKSGFLAPHSDSLIP